MRGPERENEARESRLLLNAHMSIISVVFRFFPPNFNISEKHPVLFT